ncbi:response regulator [Methanoregula sp.]|jgi:CheY-like chemotaxis protein|uniref:response regulator n=1 Tax=Methanoregula sp. TaxID=2052170 RepID=UPI003C759DD2
MITILVVDDNLDVTEVFVEMLTQGGYGASAAYSGEECLKILKEVTPDLILLDIMMEPMDGWETLEKIKGEITTTQIPVIMLTSKQVTPGEVEKYGRYIEDYVLKPVTPSQLYSVIEYVFHRRQIIQSDVDRAMRRGVYSGVVQEYALLSRSLDINKRFQNIFKTRYIVDTSNKDTIDRIGQALEKLDTTIRFQKTRLQQIEEEIKVA